MKLSIPLLAFTGLVLATTTVQTSSLRTRDVKSTIYPDPVNDRFYKAPSNLHSLQPGEIIRSRPVQTRIPSSKAHASYQVLYRTTNTQNKSEATVATLWEPFHPKMPRQILSYHSYMDSASPDCAPSWAWDKGSDSKGKLPILTDAVIFIEWALKHGIYVVDPDAQGPHAGFIAGFQEGQAALDGIRAMRNFFKMPKDTEIVLTGYSGGAHVTAWAANLAGRYAPDLNIIAACHGGTPIDTRNIFSHLNHSPFAGFAGAGLVGLMNVYPDMNRYILDHVQSDGTKLIDKYRSQGHCFQEVLYSDMFKDFFKLIKVADPLNTPIISSIMARETLLMDVSSVGISIPRYPRMIWHGGIDSIMTLSDEQKFVDQQCSHGADIQFQIFHLAEHGPAEFRGIPEAIKFLGQAFNHSTPKVPCGTSSSALTSNSPKAAMDILGNKTMQAIHRKTDSLLHKNQSTARKRRARQMHSSSLHRAM